MVYNISDVGGESVGSGTGSVDVWTFTLTKGDGITEAGGVFAEEQAPILGIPVPDPPPTVTYEFSELTGDADALAAVTLDVAGSSNTTGIYSFTVDFDQLPPDFGEGDPALVVSFTVTGSRLDDDGDLISDTDTVQIQLLICIARGTAVATPTGPRPVETLRAGDHVRLAGGRDEAIRWVGSRVLTSEELDAQPHLRPIRIAASACGPGRPDRDLLVSPQHRIEIGGWQAELLFGVGDMLAPAKGLVNGSTITVAHDVDEIEYFHLLFAQHEIILTNNLETESYFPGDTSIAGIDDAARNEVLALFPSLADPAQTTFTMARPGLKAWEARLLEAGGTP